MPNHFLKPTLLRGGRQAFPRFPEDGVSRTLRRDSRYVIDSSGGGGEIRTRGPLRDAGFQDRWFQPLTHPSASKCGNLQKSTVWRVHPAWEQSWPIPNAFAMSSGLRFISQTEGEKRQLSKRTAMRDPSGRQGAGENQSVELSRLRSSRAVSLAISSIALLHAAGSQ